MPDAAAPARDERPPDRIVAAVAGRQHGVVSLDQLRAAGLTKGAIGARVRAGRLHPLHRGVYAVGHRALPERAHQVAALLAVGPDAVLSHRSAGALWGFVEPAGGAPVEVAVSGRQARSRPGIRVHRVAFLEAGDVRRVAGLPVTAPARTLADLARGLDARSLERAVADALARGLATPAQLAADPRLRTLVAGGPRLTRSEAERRLLALVRAARLPLPATNVRVGAFEVDALWRDRRLAVEVDGFAFHGHRVAFERDRRKGLALQAAGLRLVRVSWRQLVDEPEAVVAGLAAALAAP